MTARTLTEVFTRFPLLDEAGEILLDENDDPLYDEWYSHETGDLTVADLSDVLTLVDLSEELTLTEVSG